MLTACWTLCIRRCEVCDDYIPFKEDGKSIAYKEVPFWNMRFCPSHDTRDRCCSCQRIEVRMQVLSSSKVAELYAIQLTLYCFRLSAANRSG